MKVKYINNCTAVFDFKQMESLMICQGTWALGGLNDMISWEGSYWVSTSRRCFVELYFLFEFKNALIW